jgi:hypothetical protein
LEERRVAQGVRSSASEDNQRPRPQLTGQERQLLLILAEWVVVGPVLVLTRGASRGHT